MSYIQTATEIEQVAFAVNPHGRFIEGRHTDVTEKANGSYPVIALYPFNTLPGIEPNFIDTNQIIMGFWDQDKHGNSVQQRREIIQRMADLCNSFLAQLEVNKFVRLENVRQEPQFLQYGGTLSGYAVSFNYLNFTPCE